MSDEDSYDMDINGKSTRFKHLGDKVLPEFKNVTSVSVIPFNDKGELVAIRLRHRGLDIPGGHVEEGESSPLETLEREVMEEACMTVEDPVLVDVIETDYFDEPSYMLIYGAFVKKLLPFKPSREASERVTIPITNFLEEYVAADKKLMHLAIKRAQEKLNLPVRH